ncbi:hypothetical protein ACTU44_13520 [Thalassospira sp. SM2505]|jgi:hypothetical protein
MIRQTGGNAEKQNAVLVGQNGVLFQAGIKKARPDAGLFPNPMI